MLKRKTVALSLGASLLLCLPAFSQMTSLSDLEVYHNASYIIKEQGREFDKNHWAYKSLEHLTKKYGLLLGDEDKLSGNQPLTRNEAAVILVNLIGKIEKDKAVPSEIERSQLEIMKNEFSNELTMLTGRIERLEEANNRTFKAGIGYDHKITGGLQAQYTGNYFGKGAASKPSNFSIPVADVTVMGKLREHLGYTIRMFPSRTFNSSNAVMSDVFVETDIIPKHNLILGQIRKPIGWEGSLSPYTLETVSRSQISRNFSDKRDKGITVKAFNNGLFDYAFGAYNGTPENANETQNSDLEYSFLAMINPLYKVDGYGNLKLGGTYNHGKRDYSTDIYGYFGEYKLGKYMLRAEYGKMNGYLTRNADASGWYVHNSYYLTDNLQLVGRMDNFDMDIHSGKNRMSEYTLGANYYFNDHKMKVMCDFVYAHNKLGADSRRIEVLSQYLF